MTRDEVFLFHIAAGDFAQLDLPIQDIQGFYILDIHTHQHDINVYILNHENFIIWEANIRALNAGARHYGLTKFDRITHAQVNSVSLYFQPPEAGLYHLVLDNSQSAVTPKNVTATASWIPYSAPTPQEMQIHPHIADSCSGLYRDGHYATAVFEASKALISLVKERSERPDLDGASLMRTVFSRNEPALAFNNLSDQSDSDEQEGMMHLFEGMALALRNPRGHSFRNDSPERARKYIALLDLLTDLLEETRVSEKPSSS